jgi:hypothetical protein
MKKKRRNRLFRIRPPANRLCAIIKIQKKNKQKIRWKKEFVIFCIWRHLQMRKNKTYETTQKMRVFIGQLIYISAQYCPKRKCRTLSKIYPSIGSKVELLLRNILPYWFVDTSGGHRHFVIYRSEELRHWRHCKGYNILIYDTLSLDYVCIIETDSSKDIRMGN